MTTSSGQRGGRIGLSKSRLTLFEQCPKRLWLSVHAPERADETDRVAHALREGNAIGALACALYPSGHMIEAIHGLSAACDETRNLLAAGWDKPIFEATFAHDGVLVRVDLMLPGPEGWHVAEVKGTTGVKDYHLGDLATQIWVMRQNDVHPTSVSVRHLDRGFRLATAGDYEGLFADAEVADLIEPRITQRPAIVAAARDMLQGDEPTCAMGEHCSRPFTCTFQSYCSRDLPPAPTWPASLLPDTAGKRLAGMWAEQGIDELTAIPAEAMPTPKLRRIHTATTTAVPWHDAAAILAETQGWQWPRMFLDFETIQFAVPRWIGTAPYEQVPFQFSAHVQQVDGEIDHNEFLSLDGNDPRRSCAEALVALPQAGSIIAWNASFERGCIRTLAKQFPDMANALNAMADRVVDLLPVVRRHYYHRDMRGSWSIKAVLPTVAPELDYETLDGVKSGTDAQLGYLQAINASAAPAEVDAICQSLLAYCARDTEALVVLLERLSR